MHKNSAGILLYRFKNTSLEVLLVHPGGPFFTKKDSGAWSIPKGEFLEVENSLDAAKREFKEEIGVDVPDSNFIELSPIEQKSNKTVYAWAFQGDIDTSTIKSNTFELEWPPKSGKMRAFPEIDKGEWFTITTAKEKINVRQVPLLDELQKKVSLEKD
ncbi:MAG: NUDIX domain-containing protein [Bacteroidota bacterium]|nr:NUDIX domain-containing protein [Bacteroidota bacterium]